MSVEAEIHKNFGAFQLNVSFQSSSRCIGILGASGCGKSLTLKSLAGLERPDTGRIVMNEKVLFDSHQRISLRPQARQVGYLFQNYALFPTMTVEQNIAAGLRGNRIERQRRTAEMIERFRLNGLENHYPRQLSGGQQQRTALARILAYEPKVLMLDEPFSALDGHLRDQMQRELLELLKDYEGTVILVSHSRDEIYRMSEEMLVLDQGMLVGQGATKKLFEQPERTVIARLTGCKNIARAEQTSDGLWIADWKLHFPLESVPRTPVAAVAIRAHEFSLQRTPENKHLCFPVLDPVITEDLFEYNISFRPSPQATGRIDCKISKYLWRYGKDEFPKVLYLREQDLLCLKD